MNYSFDILTLQSPSPKTQNSDRLNIIHTKKPIEKNGSWYQIAVITSIFFIFFTKTPLFVFFAQAPFFLLCFFSLSFFCLLNRILFCVPLPDQACEAFKFKFVCLCHVHQVLTLCTWPIKKNFVHLHYLFYHLYYFIFSIDCLFYYLYYFILSIDCLFY